MKIKKITKRILVVVLGLVLMISCKSSNEDVNCLTFDAEAPQLFVRIIDAEGTNLIENGTIDSTSMNIEGDFLDASFQFVPANQFGDFSEFDNSLALFIPNESTFQYTINIDNFETVVLDFNAELIRLPCDISFFEPFSANFNTKELELELFEPHQFLVVIEL